MSLIDYKLDNHVGCMVALACGDALGAPIEGLDLAAIEARYGPSGISSYDIRFSRGSGRAFRPGTYTDDTQMTIATAVAIINSNKNKEHPLSYLYNAYKHWVEQQDNELHRRGPGRTCVSTLKDGRLGLPNVPANDSKGCGGVMRVAPIGLAYGPDDAFYLGCISAALTHGHEDGWIPAGILAEIISRLLNDESLLSAIESSMQYILFAKDSNTKQLIERVVDLSTKKDDVSIETIGAGWTGDEALAIAIYCALRYKDFTTALTKAVNHSGDSDSTGSICGAIVGTMLGDSAIPNSFKKVENYKYLVELGSNMQHLRGATTSFDFERLING